MSDVVVVGAGLGGLATAIRLRLLGWRVRIVEKNERIGGRYNIIERDGYTFDTGPTLLLMRDVLDALFTSAGRDLGDYLDLIRVDPNYRVHFAGGSSLEFSSDLARMEHDLEAIEHGAAAGLRRYLADAGYKYRIARERFVQRNFLHWYNFLTPTNLYYLLTTNTLRPLDRHAARYFRDPRLQAAFTFQTMYLGLASRDAPAIYSLLPYTELAEGIWFPRGGMYRVVEALRTLAEELGVCIETGAEVVRLPASGRRILGAELASGEFRPADVVVCNADLPYAYNALVPPERRASFTARKLRRLDYGSSAFLLYLGIDREYPELCHHNVYLSSDMATNFDALFRTHDLPDDPSLYVCAASRTDRSLAPEGGEALYVLVPAPRLSPRVCWREQRDTFRDLVYDRLERVALPGLRRHVVVEQVYTPRDFAADYNIVNGSAFGLSHGFTQVGYMRPANKARELDNLYFVGAATVPGGGVPMVILGSALTTERVQRDHCHA